MYQASPVFISCDAGGSEQLQLTAGCSRSMLPALAIAPPSPWLSIHYPDFPQSHSSPRQIPIHLSHLPLLLPLSRLFTCDTVAAMKFCAQLATAAPAPRAHTPISSNPRQLPLPTHFASETRRSQKSENAKRSEPTLGFPDSHPLFPRRKHVFSKQSEPKIGKLPIPGPLPDCARYPGDLLKPFQCALSEPLADSAL